MVENSQKKCRRIDIPNSLFYTKMGQQSTDYVSSLHSYAFFTFLNETQKTFEKNIYKYNLHQWRDLEPSYADCEFKRVLIISNKIVGAFFVQRQPNRIFAQMMGCLPNQNQTQWQADSMCEIFNYLNCEKFYSSVSKHKKNLKAHLRLFSLMWGAEIDQLTLCDDFILFSFSRQKLLHKLSGRNLLNDYRRSLLLENYR